MIDDSDLSLDFQSMLLRRAGFLVKGVQSVQSLGELDADWPDAVLVDANMPDASAEEACSAARKFHPRARVVLVSGLDSEELRKLAQTCGADGFVSKAENIDVLPDVLRGLVAGTPPPSRPPDKRSALIEKFKTLFAERAERLELCAANLDEPKRREELKRVLHTIKGEATLLGLQPVAALAARLEGATSPELLRSGIADMAALL
jgi:DNA-binding response OmpR family regulator